MPEDLEQRLRPLWLSAQMGNEAAYRQALGLVADRLRGYFASRLNGYTQDVEDLVQETLLALHLQRGTYDKTTPVTAWVYGIARHKLVDHWRRRGRHDRLFDSLDDLPEALHPAAEEAAGSGHDLVQLLGLLPSAQRRSIVATRLEGLSVEEAARRQEVSESAVKINVHRGLKRLALLIRGGS